MNKTEIAKKHVVNRIKLLLVIVLLAVSLLILVLVAIPGKRVVYKIPVREMELDFSTIMPIEKSTNP